MPHFIVWLILALVALVYIAIPLFLRDLRSKYPLLYTELGEPRFRDLLVNYPSNWRKQFRFLRFSVSGKAFSQTTGSTRFLASLVFIVHLGIYAGFPALIIYSEFYGK